MKTFARVLTLLLAIPLAGHAFIGYRVLPAPNPASRGDAARHLFDIALSRTLGPGTPALSSLYVNGGLSASKLIESATLWQSTPSGEVQLATAQPDTSGGLRFILGNPLNLPASSSNLLRIRASLTLAPWPASILSFTNLATDLVLNQPGSLTLSNLNHPAGSWPNTNASIMLHHRAISLSNEDGRVPAHGLERGEEACGMAFSLRAPIYALTSAPVSITRLTVQCSSGLLSQIMLWADRGDGIFTPGNEQFLGSASTQAGETTIELKNPLIVTDQPRLLWLSVVPHVNAPVGAALTLIIPADTLHLAGTVSAVSAAAGTIQSPAGLTVQDTRPPSMPLSPLAIPGFGRILLGWLVPDNPDLDLVRAIATSGVTPSGPLDSAAGQVFDLPAQAAGEKQTTLLSGLNPLTSYTIHLWNRDSAGLWSSMLTLPSLKPDWQTNALPPPSAVQVVTSPDSWEIRWTPVPRIPVIGYRIRIANEDSGIVYPLTSLQSGPVITLTPGDLGLASLPRRARVSVVAVDANATLSQNDFSNIGEALVRGIAVRTSEAGASEIISVWNTVFRAQADRARVVLRLERESQAVVQVLSIHGQRLATLVNRRLPLGTHEFFWDGTAAGSPVNPGLYLIHVRAGEKQRMTKVIVKR